LTRINNIEVDIRRVQSSGVAEVYISAVPLKPMPAKEQAQELFSAVCNAVKSNNAHIFQERVFGVASAMKIAADVRSKIFSGINDGVEPAFLVEEGTSNGPLSGIQVHAICSETKPEIIEFNGNLCGRIMTLPGRTYLGLSSVSAPQYEQPADQAQVMLEKSEIILEKYGADFKSVARTWMWLGDVLSWYGDFNRVRNKFFTDRGIIGKDARQSMPASTGIGLGPANGGKCAMDLVAVLEPANSTEFLHVAGRQQCALEYGSAFSRASRAITPAGKTVFVSGTASINSAGQTTNIGDGPAQINETIENVRAVLKDMNCGDKDVVQVVAYCKTSEIEKMFNVVKNNLKWPWVVAIGDVCRDDLLFEIEAAALTAD
jgi:enamine deaminase RidA (YjgF/YER057c/UK114 family)